MKHNLRKKAVKAAALSSAALIGLAAGSALAYNTAHDNIVLKDAGGQKITSLSSGANAYSVRTTCFGATGCHGDANAANPTVRLGYGEIEKHSYHALNGSNETRGYNNWNPDGVLPDGSADAFRRGVSPQGKNWVQSPGHFGNW